MIRLILFFIFIILFCNLLFKCNNLFENLNPPIDFYFASPIDQQYSDQSLYNVTVYGVWADMAWNDDYMIHIMPQNLYFFLHKNTIIYHPKSENIIADCDDRYFKESFIITPKSLKVICHRNLSYLKNLFNKKVFYKTFDSLQNPETVINLILKSTYKTRGLTKILKNVKEY